MPSSCRQSWSTALEDKRGETLKTFPFPSLFPVSFPLQALPQPDKASSQPDTPFKLHGYIPFRCFKMHWKRSGKLVLISMEGKNLEKGVSKLSLQERLLSQSTLSCIIQVCSMGSTSHVHSCSFANHFVVSLLATSLCVFEIWGFVETVFPQ